MTGVPRKTIEHSLNVNPSLDPFCQKRRTFSPEKSEAVTNEVAEWVRAGIVRPVKYPTYISNPVLVKKCDGYMEMSRAVKVSSTSVPLKPTKRNLEAYVDDMVIKSKDEKDLLADIAETFENLKAINMKLNPKKCSFGVEEGKFLGYMVTSEGIRANPKKTKAISDLTIIPKEHLKEHAKSLREASFFKSDSSQVGRKGTPFSSDTNSKNITKENKHEYRWTPEAEEAFQQMKRLIMSLPSLTPPFPKETLYAYLAVAKEAVSAVLLTDRNGRQCPVQYVSRTLNDAEKNYSPLEKLALALVNMTRRLRRYFEAHPVKVITDQPIKNILSRAETSGKLAKYAVEIGTYKISFIPRNAIKGQVMADFLSDAPDGEAEEEYFRMPEVPHEIDDTEVWTLFTDGAASLKGSGAGLVLIGPSGLEYTYALRLTFVSYHHETSTKSSLARVTHYKKNEGVRHRGEDKPICDRIRNTIQKRILGPDVEAQESLFGESNAAMAYYLAHDGMLFKEEVDKCDSCQIHSPVPRLPKTYMISIMAPWPFYQWGMDILGPLTPARGGAKFVIVAIDYFTKWIEAKPLVKITDNGAQLVNEPFKGWCTRFKIQQMNTSVAHPQANGLVERANRSLMEGIKTRLGRERAGWEEYNEEEQRLNLDLLRERREAAAIRKAKYKTKMGQYYNKRVRPVGFRPGVFVYRRNEASRMEDEGKLGPNWRPNIESQKHSRMALNKLQTMEDKVVPRTWHAVN
ncbi:reverse transcriptase domain-containing protein [Tanacetum coccineum]